ncbi:hypothetical protein ACVWWT_003694, partial [Pseudomonas sp. TE6349]
MHILLRSLVFELCTRTRTGTQEERQGHRKKRFHQDDVQDKQGLRKKMWAGQTAPFFAFFSGSCPVLDKVYTSHPEFPESQMEQGVKRTQRDYSL